MYSSFAVFQYRGGGSTFSVAPDYARGYGWIGIMRGRDT